MKHFIFYNIRTSLIKKMGFNIYGIEIDQNLEKTQWFKKKFQMSY